MDHEQSYQKELLLLKCTNLTDSAYFKKEILFCRMQYKVYTFDINSVTVSLAGSCFNSVGTEETLGFRQ